jgi:hypothetical protein
VDHEAPVGLVCRHQAHLEHGTAAAWAE